MISTRRLGWRVFAKRLEMPLREHPASPLLVFRWPAKKRQSLFDPDGVGVERAMDGARPRIGAGCVA